MNLDDIAAMSEIDSDNMVARIAELPKQCRDAWRRAGDLELRVDRASVAHVVIAGMGGSAIGGALLRDLISDVCEVPVTLVRGYTLPAFAVGPETLTVACSYSGNTAETLSCYAQGLERGTQTVAITTGGDLARQALDAGEPLVQFSYRSQPRAALGYSFLLLLGVFHSLGFVRDYGDDVAEAVGVMEALQGALGPETVTGANQAKQLAHEMEEELPVIYGGGFLSATANRWKTQFNENAKSWAFFELLPELDHNAVVGLRLPEVAREHALVFLLRSDISSEPMIRRRDVTRELLAREDVATVEVWGRGETKLAQILSLVHLGDYVSFYRAMLNEVDPTPVETIAFLKGRLAQLSGCD